MYRELVPGRIVETAEHLHRRVNERFPNSGLGKVAAELVAVTREAGAMPQWLAKPNRWLRAAVIGCVALLIAVPAGVFFSVDWRVAFFSSLSDFFQGLESAINDVVFVGIAIYFLVRWEDRLKRSRVLKGLHQLRSMAHIIDMHQLTKDPEQYTGCVVLTASSPVRDLTPYQLTRYLNYCTEMLAIISKVGAVYVQQFDDPAALSAVNELENLSTGLSRKIWQKIMILDRILRPAPRP